MKILVALAALVFVVAESRAVVERPAIVPRYAGAEVGEWTMDHAAALQRARDEGRNVLVMFTGAWWCPHCQVLERTVLTNQAWQAYVETNGLYLVMFDNPGRADQYWCWLRETNYVEEVAGITLEEGEAAITNRYALQSAYAIPGAPTNTVKGVSYLRVGYPTLIGVRPDGTRLGRFSPLNSTVSLDMVLRNVSQILTADDWDEADDYYQGATGLVVPGCEDEEAYSRAHTLSEPDIADWYVFDAVAGAQWSFKLAATDTSVTNELRAQLFADPASGVSVAERQMAPSSISVLSYTIQQTGRYWLKVSRFAGLQQLQAYDLAYWYGTPPATVRFAVDRLTVSERATTVALTVNISGASSDAEVRVSYETHPGTALPGLDYVDSRGELVWPVGPKRAQTITVPLLPDAVWEGDETFRVALFAVKNCAIGAQLAVCDVVVQEQTPRMPGRLGFETAAAVTLPEGSNALFRVLRLAGSNGAVSGRVEQVSGNTRQPVATLVWANGESDAKAFSFAFTNEPGWQADRACSLKLTPLGGASLVSAAVGTVALTRRDDLVVQPLAEYAAEAANVLPGLRAVGGVWFYGYFSDDERAGAWLRSGSVAARATTTVSATLTGPGVLGYDRRAEGDGALFQFVLGGTVVDAGTNTGLRVGAVFSVPAGKQSAAWTVRRGSGLTNVWGGVRNVAWYPLPQPAEPQPADQAAVINRGLSLSWRDVVEEAVFPAGVTVRYEVFAGVSSGRLVKESEQAESVYPRPGDDLARARLDALLAQAGAKPLYWRVDIVATDGLGRRSVYTGPRWSVTCLTEGSPEFVETEGGYDPAVVGGVTIPDQMVGVYGEVGPFAVANAGEGTLRVAVKNGALPAGVAAVVRGGAVWLTGVPKRAGQGRCDLHAAVSRKVGTRTETVAGTSVTVTWRVLPLGAVAGQYDGYVLTEEGSGNGNCTLAVAEGGALSGRLAYGGLTYSFSAGAFNSRYEGVLRAQLLARAGTNALALALDIQESGSGAELRLEGRPDGVYDLWRNVWSEPAGIVRMRTYAGAYTLALPVIEASSANAPGGTGYLTFTVKANGTVTYAGLVADGKAVSGSTVLLYGPDCCSMEDRATFYLSGKPSGYGAGGGLYGLVYLKPAEDGAASGTCGLCGDLNGLRWINPDPKAVFGYDPTTGLLPDGIAGFTNRVEVTGGYYDSSRVNLTDRYGAGELGITSVFTAPADFDGEQGTSAYALASVPEPGRLPAFASGIAAVAFPPVTLVKVGTRVDVVASSNPWSMSVKPYKATGVFAGSCLFYYETAGGAKQKTRAVGIRGVFLPVRDASQDYPEWMGFYLVRDKTLYRNAAGQTTSYDFNWSYDFLFGPVSGAD